MFARVQRARLWMVSLAAANVLSNYCITNAASVEVVEAGIHEECLLWEAVRRSAGAGNHAN